MPNASSSSSQANADPPHGPAPPLKIAHVITRLIVGGAQENTLASVLGLRAIPGLEVRLLSGPTLGPEGSLEQQAQEVPGLLTLIPSLVRPIHPWHDLQAFRQLTCWFRTHRPDLVHTHSGKAGILGRLAARRARVPLVVHTIHGPSFGPFQTPIANALFRSAERFAARATTHFVVVAQAMREQYLRAGIGRPDQYTRIYSGFPLEPYLAARPDESLRHQLGIEPGDFVVGKIARLFKLKGHDDLLQVAPELLQRCPRLRWLLVGDGAWRGRLEARARQLGVHQRFTFAGLIPPSEVPRHLALMDALVHLSRREGLPRALPQALAAGRPVVAYDCDGAREICLPGETGFLVAPGDHRSLVEALLQLAADHALRERFARRGQDLVRQWFPVEKMLTELDQLYRRLAQSIKVHPIALGQR